MTLPLHSNYGGILQAYALRTVLEARGHEAFHVEKKRNRPAVHLSPIKFYSWWFTRRLIRQILTLNRDKNRREENLNRYRVWTNTPSFRAFVKKHVPLKVVYKFENLRKLDFDTIVVGSDQIWRPYYYRDIDLAFLSFASEWSIKRIAYAPSFGVEDWEYSKEQTLICRSLLQKFDAVSVREKEGVGLCADNFNVHAVQLLDPTMLLDRDHYEQLIGEKVKSERKQLTTYILDMEPRKREILEYIQAAGEMEVVESGRGKGGSIEQWLCSFMEAEFIFTDSFHGCVFSILFHKPFLVYGNRKRGLSRFNTLLKLFQLEDRMIFNADEAGNMYKRKIDWNIIDVILKHERKRAFTFLEDSGL